MTLYIIQCLLNVIRPMLTKIIELRSLMGMGLRGMNGELFIGDVQGVLYQRLAEIVLMLQYCQ